MLRGQRFFLEHIQSGAGQPAAVQCPEQGRGAHHGATAHVDEHRAGFHKTEMAVVEQAPGVVGERRRHDHVIRVAEQGRQVFLTVYPGEGRILAGPARGADHLHAQAAQHGGDFPADRTGPHHQGPGATDHGGFPVLPAPLPLQRQIGEGVLGEQQHRAEHVFGDAPVENARGIGDREIAVLDRRNHQGVHARAGGVHPAYRAGVGPGGFQGLDAEIGDHQDVRFRQRLGETVVAPHLAEGDVPAQPVQAGQGGFVLRQQDGDPGFMQCACAHGVSFSNQRVSSSASWNRFTA